MNRCTLSDLDITLVQSPIMMGQLNGSGWITRFGRRVWQEVPKSVRDDVYKTASDAYKTASQIAGGYSAAKNGLLGNNDAKTLASYGDNEVKWAAHAFGEGIRLAFD